MAGEYEVHLRGRPSGLRALATPDRLSQVLDNLLANATEASPPGTTVEVAARPTPTGSGVEVHVTDQGSGLTEEQRQRAFDRFWRAGDATGPGGLGGTGLGLSIVRQLVRADGGEVELDEATGGGLDAVVRLVGPP